jgi:predicted nicotinamide N-methyase
MLALLAQPAAALLPRSLARRTVQVELTPSLRVGVVEIADWSWWDEQSVDERANPYGAKLWPAAVAVAREVALLPPGALDGKTVLELGCGNGLCSLTAAASGAASVLATDLSEDALGLTAEAASAADLPVLTSRFDLGGPEPLPAADLVIAADLCYDEQLAAALAVRVAQAVRRGSWVLVGSDLQRGPRHGFLRKLRELVPPPSGGLAELAFDDSARVALQQVGWKEKRIGMLRLNVPVALQVSEAE